MTIFISKNDLWLGATDDDARYVTQELRERGFDVLNGTARRGQLTVSDVIELATAVAEIQRGVTLGEAPEDLISETKVIVAEVPGHEPLKRYAGVWSAMTLSQRTAVIANYYKACQQRDMEETADRKFYGQLSERSRAALEMAIEALPFHDRLMFPLLGIVFTEEHSEEFAGEARSTITENKGARNLRIALNTNLPDRRLLMTICHEILHQTRQHGDLLAFTRNEEEEKSLTAIFERQAECIAPKWAYEAVVNGVDGIL